MVYNFLIALLLIFITIIAIANSPSLTNIRPYSDQIISSLKKQIIYSIELSDSITKCPSNSIPLLIDNYQGTKEGCLSGGVLTKGRCSLWTKMFYSYKEIPSYDPVNIYTLYGNVLCVTIKELNYTELIKKGNIIVGKNCSSGYKKCGIIDTSNNIYCVNETEACPINDIVINEETTHDNYISLQFRNSGKYLHYTNEKSEGNILTTWFKISEGSPCTHPYEINTKYVQYSLEIDYDNYTCKTSTGESLTDLRYHELTSYKKSTLYSENIINVDKLEQFPKYTLDIPIQVYTMKYLGLKGDCDISLFNDNNNSYESISNIFHVIIMIFCRFSSGYFIFISVVKISKSWDFDHFTYILDFCFIGFMGIQAILSTIVYIILTKYQTINSSCGGNDLILIKQIEYINEVLYDTKKNNLIILSFSLGSAILMAISVGMKKCGVQKDIEKERYGYKQKEMPKRSIESSAIEMRLTSNKIDSNNISLSDSNQSKDQLIIDTKLSFDRGSSMSNIISNNSSSDNDMTELKLD